MLLLQEFNVTIVDKHGRANVVSDFLSCLIIEEDKLVQDHVPYE